MDLIERLLYGLVEGLFWGIVFLFLAVLLLPDRLFAKILKRIKPDFVSRLVIIGRVKSIVDYLLNRKDIVVEESFPVEIKDKQNVISEFIQEKRILEGNLFFLDLLKSLTSIMSYSVIHAGYDDKGLCSMLGQSMDYLRFYAKEIHDTKKFGNQAQRIGYAAGELEEQLAGVSKYLSTAPGNEHLKTAKEFLKMGIGNFDSYIREEYESVKLQLSRLNQLLADRIMDYIGDEI